MKKNSQQVTLKDIYSLVLNNQDTDNKHENRFGDIYFYSCLFSIIKLLENNEYDKLHGLIKSIYRRNLSVDFSADIKYILLSILSEYLGAECMNSLDLMVFKEREKYYKQPYLRNINLYAFCKLQKQVKYIVEDNPPEIAIQYLNIVADAIRCDLQVECFLNTIYKGEENSAINLDGNYIFPCADIYSLLFVQKRVKLDDKTILLSPVNDENKLNEALNEALIDIISNKFDEKLGLYQITLLDGLNIAVAQNGFHHLSVAGLLNSEDIHADSVIDFKNNFNKIRLKANQRDEAVYLSIGDWNTPVFDNRLAMIILLEQGKWCAVNNNPEPLLEYLKY